MDIRSRVATAGADLVGFPVLLIGLAASALGLCLLYSRATQYARRRRVIQENGCEPIYHYQHKGILGKFLGLDVLLQLIEAAKEGRALESSRLRNFSDGRRTVQMRRFSKSVIVTIEPENVKTMLATKFKDFSLGKGRKELFIPLLGHGIFDTDGPAWERSRALIRPNFVRQQVADLNMFETHLSHLLHWIPRDGSTVDLQDLFFGLTMDSATEFLFGRSTDVLAPGVESSSTKEFAKAFDYCTEAISTHFRTAGMSRLIPDAKRRRSIKTVHAFADGLVEEALQSIDTGDPEKTGHTSSGKYTFLHELISQTRDPYILRSELLNILLAGRDTTAGLLSNTWHVLSKRPDIWAKLLHEVQTLDGERPTYSTLKDMKYLKYVLNESLRLMPLVPGNSREAVRDVVLPLGGGLDGKSPILIPKGQSVNYSVWSMHRRKDFFGEDALEFKPERWMNLRPGWEYLPFNGGPRICVGQQYALLEASYVTVRIMQHFPRIESRDPGEWKERVAITLSSMVGCKVALFEK